MMKNTGPYINLFLAIFTSLLTFEIASRILYQYVTPKTGRAIVNALRGETDPKNLPMVKPHPYMLYINTPNWEKDGVKQINSLGYRGEEITKLSQPGVIRILTLGSSTTLSYPYVNRPAESWTAQLQEILNRRIKKKKIEIVNGGLNYATSAELLLHYTFRDRYLKPKFVIIHEGYNDLIPLLFDNYNPEYTHYRTGWSFANLTLRPGEKYLLKLNLIRILYSWWLNQTSLQKSLGQPQDWQNLPPSAALANVQKNEPDGYRRNLDILVRNIIQDGAIPIFFPVIMAPKEYVAQLPEIGELITRYYDAFSIGLNKNRQVMKEIAGKYRIPYVEIPDDKIPEEYFIDHIHLNAFGEKEKASFLESKLSTLINKY